MSDNPMPKAGPEHYLLAPFEGKFRSIVKIWMGPGEPITTTGIMTNTFQLGGLYLHQDYVGDATGGPFPAFCGKGYWGYNPFTKKYEGFWIDNASSMMQMEQGTVDATSKIWTMHSEFVHPQSGQCMKKVSVITLIDNDHHSMTSDFMSQDGKPFRAMELAYNRIQ
ncbi:MAG: DUF1579 family protein [Pirellula sp.]